MSAHPTPLPQLVFAGDYPDPTVLRDGADYYMTFSSFDYYPGLVLWHSRDLKQWQRLGAALHEQVGSVWAPELVKHEGRYFVYFATGDSANYVIWTDDIGGRWSTPVALPVRGIDPGHIVALDGSRYLFLNNGRMVRLRADGLGIAGEPMQVYTGWNYPEDWLVETFALEGPKLFRRGEFFYMLSAQGGTAGPPTSHMVVAARARRVEGPWENSPHNPIVRTRSAAERWWSQGHGTLVNGPDGEWCLFFHAYENGYRTLGRQTLMQAVRWTDEGWFVCT